MKTFTLFIIALFLAVTASAQSPQSFRYQSVARDNSGNILINKSVSFRISILSGSVDGIAAYSETHTGKSTNSFGLVELEIGKGTPVNGTFSSIDWGSNSFFVKIEMDQVGGTDYQVLSTSQLLSVPYALHAKTATSYEENDPTWVGEANENSSVGRTGNIGIGITTPNSKLDVAGEINVNNNKIKNVADPVNAQDAATKAYVDAMITQLSKAGAIVADADGNIYPTVRIGSQIWMAEDLRTTKYNDGSAIPYVTDGTIWSGLTTGAYCWYNNDAATYKNLYGALYNWQAVKTGKLCPEGWHVPSDAEWTILENYLIANGYNYDGTTSGNKIAKSLAALTNWIASTGTGAVGNTDFPSYRNKSGFSCLPGSSRNNVGDFGNIGYFGYWWSSTEYTAISALYRSLGNSLRDVSRSEDYKTNGFSVRCVRDF